MSQNTKTEDQKHESRSRFIRIVFAVLIVFVYFFGLTIPLLGPDEPRYTQVAREMFERGDWVTPTLGGFDWFEKPALLYWLQIASFHIFGVTEFAARFGSALFGLGTIFCLWILGRKWTESSEQWLEEERKTEAQSSKFKAENSKTDFADWIALTAASSIGLIAFARGASFDIILTFPITASLAGFFIWEISRREHRKHGKMLNEHEKSSVFSASSAALFSFYFFIGVAMIAKGLVGIVFPFAIAVFYYVLSRRFPPKEFIFSLVWGTLLSLAVASIWYLPMYITNGWKFIDEFFIQHHFQRYTSNKYQHPQPFWFFWLVLPLMTIPWLPFFLASLRNLIKGFFQRKNAKTQKDNETPKTQDLRLTTFALSWMLVPLVFFSASGSKLPGYILPALPAAIILTAVYVYEFVRKSEKRRAGLQILAFLTFVIIFVLLQFFVEPLVRHDTTKNLVRAASEKGFNDEKILTLHTISHNLEFYGAGRLVRLPDGKQRYFYGTAEIAEYIRINEKKPVLVFLPVERIGELNENPQITAEILGDNGEHALAAVSLK